MLTISAVSELAGLSRSTLLYYERIGLFEPSSRSPSGYRLYGSDRVERLQQIADFRAMGVPLGEISELLDREGRSQLILQQQLHLLQQKIDELRSQQQTILQFLEQPDFEEEQMVTKERWTEIMRASGMTDEDMHNWHRQFEKMEPEAHEEFLVSLQIDGDEIEKIRAWSRS